ncbi:chlorophyllase-2-like [Cornus florida]|uniref:chlorophyllase-2-like n=1 Tax=Cornus florida TaxID=4283 RepID=UPI00289EE1E6|nr:chlorophyllase-2-like [Cornus florida]
MDGIKYAVVTDKSCKQVKCVAVVTDWLCTGLQIVLADYSIQFQPNLLKLGLYGHNKGGLIAFAIALGHAGTSLKFSALIGIDLDLVAGCSPNFQLPPHILTYVPYSFDLGIPVSVFGTSLGDELKEGCIMAKPCALDGVNHIEFFTECKPPCYYFLAKEYGHMDMLNDNAVSGCACASGDIPSD